MRWKTHRAESTVFSFIQRWLTRHSARRCCATFYSRFAAVAVIGLLKQLLRNKSNGYERNLATKHASFQDCLVVLTPLSRQPSFTKPSAIGRLVSSSTMVCCVKVSLNQPWRCCD